MKEHTVLEEDTTTVKAASNTVAVNGFAQDAARYFKTFLETDLRGNLIPSRQITRKRLHGLATQLYLQKYPQLNKNLKKNFISGFAQEAFVVSQNKYVTHGEERLSDEFARGIESIDDTQIQALVRSCARVIDLERVKHDQLDMYQAEVLVALKDVLAAELVVPLLRGAQKKNGAEEAHELPLQEETTEKLYGAFAPALEQVVARYFHEAQSFDTLLNTIQSAMDADATRIVLREFLDEVNTTDAYQEIYQLHRNTQTLTDSDLYLYFCEISIGSVTFPLFYMPLSSAHSYPSVTFMFEDQIHVNTKALQFVLKEYNRLMQLDLTFDEDIQQVIYIDERQRRDVLPALQTIVDILSATFGLESSLALDNTADHTTTSSGVTMSNRLQLAIFDKSNEAIIKDYEEILTPGSKAARAFATLMDEFVMNTPVRLVQEVAEEWKAKSVNEKLLSSNPLPLNDEQKQALLALSKEDTKTVVVNGASGTGKSHLVSGIVSQSIQEGFSTLVLTNTPAVLDSVEDTIMDLLSEVRGKKPYHYPVLRLGETSSDFLDDIEGQYLQELRNFHELYTKLQGEMRTAKNRKIQDAADQLNAVIQSAENVNLHEIEQIVNNETKFGGRDWVQDEPIEHINSDLQKLHQAIQYIRKSEANYLLPYIESSQQKTIAAFLSTIRDYEKANKTVHKRLPEFIVRYRKLLPEQKSNLQSALSYIHSNYRQYVKILSDDAITSPLDISDSTDYETLGKQQALLNKLIGVAHDSRRLLTSDKNQDNRIINELLSYDTPPSDVVDSIKNYIDQVISLRSKIFGFSGRTLVIENLTKQLKKSIPQFSMPDPEKNMDDLQQIVDLAGYIIEQLAQLGLDLDHWKAVLHILKTDSGHLKELQKLLNGLVQPADFEFMGKHQLHEADNLLANINLLQYASEMNDVFQANPNLSTLFGIKTIGQVLKQPDAYSTRFNKLANDLEDVKQLDEYKKTIKDFLRTYPNASRRLGVNYINGTLDIIDDTFANSSTEEIKEYLAFKKKEQDMTSYFREMIADSYDRTVSDLTQMTALQVSHSLDLNLIKYVETRAADFNAIKSALRTKQQIAPQIFSGLQTAFPCMLADIREYAKYVPLKSEQFDVVVIDEASRINVAEALPALLRARKIVILGDDQQFRSDKSLTINQSHNKLFHDKMLASFTGALRSLPADTKNAYIAKVRQNFDVQNSILSFARSIANNELTLTKYFRSPPELMSYNDKHFYNESLRNLKARALSLNETIRFDYVEDTDSSSTGLHSNLAEARHIIESLNAMRDAGYAGTIGIITPYHEQAVLIQAQIDEGVITDWFEQRQVKVMTFDTAQGEVRDYIFYSMVASERTDRLDYVFPSTESSKDVVADERANQRLAVGLSRAESVVHFVLSQPIDNFKGELQNVLTHYQSKLTAGTVKVKGNTTDILTAGESLLPQYFYATKFYKKYTDKTRLITQFNFGDLLRALSPRYRHPGYKIDFMVVFGDQRIIVTYDEFRENFLANETGKDAGTYLTQTDIYNQKVLESYGYKFLRLNKFNLGAKPTDTLDKLLAEVIKDSSWPRDNGFIVK